MRAAIVLLLFVGCVPHVALLDAPCPCAAGAACCETLGVCLPDGETCPATVPSTTDACRSDADCGAFEACAAWTADDGTLAGPQVCRRRCADDRCDGTERCLFTFSDGQPTDALSFRRLCLDVTPDCEAWTCEGCGDLAIGEVTSCDTNDELIGCLFSLHPTCGLKCEQKTIGQCENLVSPCTTYSCGRCPGGKPGPPICDAGTERSCLVSTTSGGLAECQQLCFPVETGMCTP